MSPLEGDTSGTLSVDRDQGSRPSVARTVERLYVAGVGVHAVDPVSGERAWAFEPDVDGYVHVEAGAPSTVFAHADATSGRWTRSPATRGGPSIRSRNAPVWRPPATSHSSASTGRSTRSTAALGDGRYSSDMSAVQRSRSASALRRSIRARMAAAKDAVSAAFASPSVRNSPVTRLA